MSRGGIFGKAEWLELAVGGLAPGLPEFQGAFAQDVEAGAAALWILLGDSWPPPLEPLTALGCCWSRIPWWVNGGCDHNSIVLTGCNWVYTKKPRWGAGVLKNFQKDCSTVILSSSSGIPAGWATAPIYRAGVELPNGKPACGKMGRAHQDNLAPASLHYLNQAPEKFGAWVSADHAAMVW